MRAGGEIRKRRKAKPAACSTMRGAERVPAGTTQALFGQGPPADGLRARPVLEDERSPAPPAARAPEAGRAESHQFGGSGGGSDVRSSSSSAPGTNSPEP